MAQPKMVKTRYTGIYKREGANHTAYYVVEHVPAIGNERATQKWHSYGSLREARDAQTEIRDRKKKGTYVAPSKTTLGEFLTERWLPTHASQIAPSTYESYAANVRIHIKPQVGSVQLQALTPDLLTRFYGERLKSGRSKNGKEGGLSARTVRYLHAIIHKALADAMRWGLVVRNVAEAASPPSNKVASATAVASRRAWPASDLRKFLASVRGSRLEPLWTLYATTGMRRGEGLALRWTQVDLDGARLSLPVTKSKPRSVDLAPSAVALLRAQRKRQAAEKLALGAAYSNEGYVFCREDGVGYAPDYITRAFREAIERAELPRIRLHDLRHTWASLALAAGESPKVVADQLGHHSAAFTLDTYSHVFPGLQKGAAQRVAALIEG